jgi:hypothetical protein
VAEASNRTETRIQRRLLRKFVDAEPARIALSRPTISSTPGGGLKKTFDTTLAPQDFRLVPFKKRLTSLTRDTPDGNIINLAYVLIGEHDADVKPGDYFEWGDGMYDVVSIEPNRSYRTAANITYRGLKSEDWG